MTNLLDVITIEVIINSLLLSLLGSLIRVLFTNIENFILTVKLFIGSILFGTLAGYILNDFEALKDYNKIIITFISIFGKEFYVKVEAFVKNPKKGMESILEILDFIKRIKINVK